MRIPTTSVATAVVLILVATAATAQTAPVAIDLPPQSLSAALRALGKATDTNILIDQDLVRNLNAPGIRESLTAEEGIARLLKGTGIGWRFVDEHTVVLSKAAEEGKPTALASASKALRLAQADEASSATPAASSVTAVEAGVQSEEKLEEINPNLEKIPEVLVRGSAITNVDIKRTENDVQPYYILDSKMIEKSGATNVEDFLKQRLTMNTTFVSNSQVRAESNGLNNTNSTINLRGLGANETLILIDGRRVAGVSLKEVYAQPDINGISLSSIERIEVLPSSASAIYGGAAIGGVVNIILKKNFQGGDVGVTYENVTEGDVPQRTINATYGFSLEGGKSRIMLSGHYHDGSALRQEDRLKLFQRGISTILKNSPSYLYNEFFPFYGATPNISGLGTNLTLLDGTPLNSSITWIPSGADSSTDLTAGLLQNAGTYNLNLAPGVGTFGLQSVIGVGSPLTKSVSMSIRREFSERLDAFVDVSVQSNASRGYTNSIASSSFFIPAGTPTNPFREDVFLTSPSAQRFGLGSESLTRSATIGLVARLPGSWSSELDYTVSRNAFSFANDSPDSAGGQFSTDLLSGGLDLFVDTLAHPWTCRTTSLPPAARGTPRSTISIYMRQDL